MDSPSDTPDEAPIPDQPDHVTATFKTTDSELPPLPVTDANEDLSLTDPPESETSALLERDMKRKLMDMESSFIPDCSPLVDGPTKGADDTYLFGGSPNNGKKVEKQDATLPRITEEPPMPVSTSEMTQSTNGSSEVQDSTMSPTAAAAQRTQDRIRSSAQTLQSQDIHEGRPAVRPEIPRRSSSKTPTKSAPESDYSMQTPSLSPEGNSDGTITSLQSPLQSMSSVRLLKRPSLHSRQASNRSSIASFTSDCTDITLGADYALQSGGAAPTSNPNKSSIALSRLPSLGSIASSINSNHSDTAPSWNRSRSSTTISGAVADNNLGKLNEERNYGESPPATPRPYDSNSVAPTD